MRSCLYIYVPLARKFPGPQIDKFVRRRLRSINIHARFRPRGEMKGAHPKSHPPLRIHFFFLLLSFMYIYIYVYIYIYMYRYSRVYAYASFRPRSRGREKRGNEIRLFEQRDEIRRLFSVLSQDAARLCLFLLDNCFSMPTCRFFLCVGSLSSMFCV